MKSIDDKLSGLYDRYVIDRKILESEVLQIISSKMSHKDQMEKIRENGQQVVLLYQSYLNDCSLLINL